MISQLEAAPNKTFLYYFPPKYLVGKLTFTSRPGTVVHAEIDIKYNVHVCTSSVYIYTYIHAMYAHTYIHTHVRDIHIHTCTTQTSYNFACPA